jgi:hypothetical protein
VIASQQLLLPSLLPMVTSPRAAAATQALNHLMLPAVLLLLALAPLTQLLPQHLTVVTASHQIQVRASMLCFLACSKMAGPASYAYTHNLLVACCCLHLAMALPCASTAGPDTVIVPVPRACAAQCLLLQLPSPLLSLTSRP